MPALPKISADYGNGFQNAILINGVPLHVAHPGEVFWVDENASRTGRGTFKSPDTTVNAAYDRTVADRGDIIMVKPGHTEDVAAAGGTLAMDTAGVALVGIGRGEKQPQFTFSTATTADINISGANNSIIGFRFTNNIDDLAGGLDVSGDDLLIQGCRFDVGTADATPLIWIAIADGTDRFSIIGCQDDNNLSDSTYANSWIKTEGTHYGFTSKFNKSFGYYAVANYDLDDDVISGPVLFERDIFINLDTDPGMCVLINAATVGVFERSSYGGTLANTEPISDISASFMFETVMTDVEGSAGLIHATVTAWT
jgi:hypothetical protein